MQCWGRSRWLFSAFHPQGSPCRSQIAHPRARPDWCPCVMCSARDACHRASARSVKVGRVTCAPKTTRAARVPCIPCLYFSHSFCWMKVDPPRFSGKLRRRQSHFPPRVLHVSIYRVRHTSESRAALTCVASLSVSRVRSVVVPVCVLAGIPRCSYFEQGGHTYEKGLEKGPHGTDAVTRITQTKPLTTGTIVGCSRHGERIRMGKRPRSSKHSVP